MSRIQAAKTDLAERLGRFDFSKAALGLYDHVFGELCDWYLELVKPRLAESPSPELTSHLVWVLRETLLLCRPLIPFVTEELWLHLQPRPRITSCSQAHGRARPIRPSPTRTQTARSTR